MLRKYKNKKRKKRNRREKKERGSRQRIGRSVRWRVMRQLTYLSLVGVSQVRVGGRGVVRSPIGPAPPPITGNSLCISRRQKQYRIARRSKKLPGGITLCPPGTRVTASSAHTPIHTYIHNSQSFILLHFDISAHRACNKPTLYHHFLYLIYLICFSSFSQSLGFFLRNHEF